MSPQVNSVFFEVVKNGVTNFARVIWRLNAKMVDVWPRFLMAYPAWMVLIFVLVKKVLSEATVVVVCQKTFHAHQLLGMGKTMPVKLLLIGANCEANFARVMMMADVALKVQKSRQILLLADDATEFCA